MEEGSREEEAEGGGEKGRQGCREGWSEREENVRIGKEWKKRVEGGRERVKKGSEWKEEGRNEWMDRGLEGEGIGRERDRGMNQREGRRVGDG